MQRHIQQITQQFVNRLPENDQYYRPDELRSWEFPSFLVERIKIELERNLEESLIIPKTDWANTQSDAVQHAWQKFVDAIQAEVHLPASYGKTVIETAVADIMEMLVQPRKNIPEVVFGQDDQLSYNHVCERVKAVVVYPHFARLIPRYMQKKELETLTKSRCRKIVSTADAKLTSRYSPLNWAQMLEPIFKLVDGEIDTNLLRLFFEDKNMPRVARKFDLMNDSLTRAEFIEVLSSPELLDVKGYEDDQSTLFEDQPVTTPSDQESSDLKIPDRRSTKEEKEEQQDFPDESIEKSDPTADIPDQQDESESAEEELGNTVNSGFFGEDEQKLEAEETDDDEDSINALFKDQKDQEEEKAENGETPEQTKFSKDDQVLKDREIPDQPEKQSAADEQEKSDAAADEGVQTGSNEKAPQENGEDKTFHEGEEETPIWMRFMSDDEIEEFKKEQEQEQQDDEVEEGFIDDPIVDLTKENASDEEIDNLRDRLSADKDLFVEEIFGGSERAFDEAVENIAPYNSWREVSKYIEKEIFKRNLVDVYSEAAVNFTDQLQSYFLEKNKSK